MKCNGSKWYGMVLKLWNVKSLNEISRKKENTQHIMNIYLLYISFGLQAIKTKNGN